MLFRTEASALIGMGHLMRCMSLAKMIKNNFDITFILEHHLPLAEQMIKGEKFNLEYIDKKMNENALYNEAEVVVLDGYNYNEETQKKVKANRKKLVFIDDVHNQHFYADAIINVSDSVSKKDYSVEPYTKLFLGSKYALLRIEFIEAAKKAPREITRVNRVFLSMGGGDSANITLKALKALHTISSLTNIHVVIGAVNPHREELQAHIDNTKGNTKIILHSGLNAAEMISIMNECQVAICPASGTSLEVAAVGSGMISGYTATNQKGILSGLLEHKCAVSVGDLNAITVEELSNNIEQCIKDLSIINAMIKHQKKLVDGLSPLRIVNMFKELEADIEWRTASINDADLYFQWANDDVVRQNSFEQNKISYEEHVKWFKSKLASPDCFFYLFTKNNLPVGQVRIENKKEETVIGVSVDEKFRGKGLGSLMLELASTDFFIKFPQKTISAYIKEDNAASIAIFKKANFENEEKVMVSGAKSIKLRKTSKYEF